MNPYPLIYCPPRPGGSSTIDKPRCCAHRGGVKVKPGMGPAGADPDEPLSACYEWGMCYGGAMDASQPWIRTRGGWWVLLAGHLPQHLARLQLHPSILRWRTIAGAASDHSWRVPVLISPNELAPQPSYLPATDQVWNGEDWRASDDLVPLQLSLMAIGNRTPLAIDRDERNHLVRRLAIDLLAMGQWVDEDLLAAAGWFTETLMIATILAGMDQSVDDAASAPP